MGSVKIIECPRDAWQGLKLQIPTERKTAYLRALVAAGFKHVDAVSFVSPKAIPQMADSEQVLETLSVPSDVELIGIVVNEKGADRAMATKKVTTLGYPYSISETFLRRNQNQSGDESLAVMKQIKARADDAGLGMVVYISMAFGNPYGDRWSEAEVGAAAQRIAGIGVNEISVADTVGAADAELIQRVVTTVLHECDGIELGVHLHSARVSAAAKVLTAYDAGCRRFDAAIGGLGGCPFAQDELIGNIPTEEVLQALKQRGVDPHIDLSGITTLNAAIGAEFSSEVLRHKT
jgi:hydroxymethylglutaryl-CoA lyase